MDEKRIARINELYHKSKAEGLTEDELKEQQILRREYIDSFRRNLKSQLDNISIIEADGPESAGHIILPLSIEEKRKLESIF